MSAWCHYRPNALHQNDGYSITSVALASSDGGEVIASRIRGLPRLIPQHVLRRRLHRQVAWLLAFQNAIDVRNRPPDTDRCCPRRTPARPPAATKNNGLSYTAGRLGSAAGVTISSRCTHRCGALPVADHAAVRANVRRLRWQRSISPGIEEVDCGLSPSPNDGAAVCKAPNWPEAGGYGGIPEALPRVSRLARSA